MLETLTALQLTYGFVSNAFLVAPEPAWVQKMAEDRLFEVFPLESRNGALDQGLQLLRASAGQAKNLGYAEAAAELRRDHAALFVGPDHLLAPPWESVYRSRDHLLFGDETMAVRSWYRRYGLQAKNLNREPDDHVGLEFAFLAHLATLALDAQRAGDEGAMACSCRAQSRFLQEHVMTWTPEFLGNVTEHAATDYFRGVGRLTEGAVTEAVESLGVMQG
jgi:TorA maturation chaperone TorD